MQTSLVTTSTERNGCYYFSGQTNCYLAGGSTIQSTNFSNYTWSFWIKTNQQVNPTTGFRGSTIITEHAGTDPLPDANYRIALLPSGKISCLGYDNFLFPTIKDGIDSSSFIVNDNQWHHITLTVDNNTMRLYHNGIKTDSTYYNQGWGDNYTSNTNYVGGHIGGTYAYLQYVGYLDDIGLWSRSLNEQEVLQLHNGYTVNTDKSKNGFNIKTTNENLIVESDSYFSEDYKIYNMIGNLIKSNIVNKNENSIDISELSNGCYILQMKDAYFKFIK